MNIFGRLQNVYVVLGVAFLIFSFAKLGPWFLTPWGLSCVMLGASVFAYLRWKVLKRQLGPETRGNYKKIQSVDIQRIKPWMFKNIIGQGSSIHNILQILKRNVDMIDSNRHLGSYLLVGPTGTGKTFFAQLLSEGLYGRGSLLKIAMNQGGLSGERLIEIILQSLKQNPYKVLLLDELDKAPKDVQSALYHILESGQLMDQSTGEWFHCPGLVIIATTNAASHSKEAAQDAQKNHYGLLDHVAANSSMEKALLSRFDGLFWFGSLGAIDIAQVCIMQVSSYYRQHGIEVNYLCAEAIIDIVKDNQRFKEFGIRQLIQVVRHKSDPIIQQAKNNGWKEIEIISDNRGNFIPQIIKKRKIAA
jgi:ATP-dependent Clp protease ATP-binding subunit ClpC